MLLVLVRLVLGFALLLLAPLALLVPVLVFGHGCTSSSKSNTTNAVVPLYLQPAIVLMPCWMLLPTIITLKFELLSFRTADVSGSDWRGASGKSLNTQSSGWETKGITALKKTQTGTPDVVRL